MHAVSKVSEKISSMARGTVLLMLCSLIVSALVSFGAVRFFFVIKADKKAQAVRREEERKNREQVKSPVPAVKRKEAADEGWARSAREGAAERKSRVEASETTIDDIHYEAVRRDLERAGLDPDSQDEATIRHFNKILRDNGMW